MTSKKLEDNFKTNTAQWMHTNNKAMQLLRENIVDLNVKVNFLEPKLVLMQSEIDRLEKLNKTKTQTKIPTTISPKSRERVLKMINTMPPDDPIAKVLLEMYQIFDNIMF